MKKPGGNRERESEKRERNKNDGKFISQID